MKCNISEIAMTSCRLVDQSSILPGAGINLFWTISWTYPLCSTEVHLGKIYESEGNMAPPSSAKAETAWSISPTRLRDLLLNHITIFLCSISWNCVVTPCGPVHTRVGTLIVATIYLQLIQNRYMFRSFTVLQCSYQHCVQPVFSDVEVVGYL